MSIQHGWFTLPCGVDVHLHRGVPMQVSNRAGAGKVAPGQVEREIYEMTGLSASVGPFEATSASESVAPVTVSRNDLAQVLDRFATVAQKYYPNATITVEGYQALRVEVSGGAAREAARDDPAGRRQ